MKVLVQSQERFELDAPRENLEAAKDAVGKAYAELDRQILEAQRVVVVQHLIEGCLPDVAHAFSLALLRQFKFKATKAGNTILNVRTGPKQRDTVAVPWGTFTVPGVRGTITTAVGQDESGTPCFQLAAKVQQRDQDAVKALADLTRDILAKESLYRGKAIQVPDFGVPFVQPLFMDVAGNGESSLILPGTVASAVETSVFTPIRDVDLCREAHIPLKRGVLLAGAYGTGKTLCAFVTANLCEANGWTFVYAQVEQLAQALAFARRYQPAVVFAEDIDRVMNERDESANDILNTIDGIDSKSAEIMVILTTNHVERVHAAMLRPGRLDAVIHFTAPDADAAARLIRHYSRDLLARDADVAAVGTACAGMIPAVIREVVERGKLAAIKLTGAADLTVPALLESAAGMRAQLGLGHEPQPETVEERAGRAILAVVEKGARAAA